MMIQIEFLIMNLKKNDENITNFDHEYIEGSFLFNTRSMQRSFYLRMIGKFVLLNLDRSLSQ
jgi:hypothetical protein